MASETHQIAASFAPRNGALRTCYQTIKKPALISYNKYAIFCGTHSIQELCPLGLFYMYLSLFSF